jgi:hypothetical protein
MKTKIVCALTLAALGGITFSANSAMAAQDHFDRAALGKRWVVTDPSLTIVNDQMQGSNLGLGYFKRSSGDTKVSATVILSGSGLQYGAVATGDIATHNNAFVKIQSDDGVNFDFGAFYVGDNGGGVFFALDSLVPSPALLTVSMCGSVATMTIKSSAGTQKYTNDYGSGFGTGGGLGTYGPIALDDYKSKPAGSCTVDSDAIVVKATNARDMSLAK